jgi:hypothetical protein
MVQIEIGGIVYGFERGFIEAVTLDTAAFLTHAAALFAAQPITAVRLADKEPDRGGDGCWRWYRGVVSWLGRDESDAVPGEIFSLIDALQPYALDVEKVLTGRGEALAALSAACCAFGRAAAGLPPLARAGPGPV